MFFPKLEFPITEQPSWSINDSSKLTDSERCLRYYFFRHLLGWRPDRPAQDLHFGSSWHKAREYQLCYGYEDIQGAYNAFIEEYRKEFDPSTDEYYSPKTPTGVLNALTKFAEERSLDLIENEVVVLDGMKMLEISGKVSIGHDRSLCYRLDSIMRRVADGMIFSWDHKTTSEKYVNGRAWSDQFFLSLQNGTYTHCLYCLFPIADVLGVEFCGTGFAFLKRGSSQRSAGYHATLKRVPAYKTPDQMNVWLWTVHNLIDDIEREFERLSKCTPNDPVMTAFPMRSKGCTDFRGCPYLDYCIAWPNPLRQCNEPPLGFVQEFWNPLEMESTVKKDLDFSM